MSVVTIYTTKFCGYCIMAKRLLKSRGIAYEEINISEKEIGEQNLLRTWLIEASG